LLAYHEVYFKQIKLRRVTMEVDEIKKYEERALISLKRLPEEKLRTAVDFIEYLQSREEWEATWEILTERQIMADIEAAEEDWKAGRKENFLPWDQIKRDV
jgi:hypothetical protein